jgi:hypothetical protein
LSIDLTVPRRVEEEEFFFEAAYGAIWFVLSLLTHWGFTGEAKEC